MNRRLRLTLALVLGVGPLGLVVPPPPAQAQAPAAPANDGAALNPNKKRTLADALAAMSRASGLNLVADSSLAQATVAAPAEATTPENVEAQLTALVKSLPAGATWARLYLPSPAGRRAYSGDDVAAFAAAQARLVGAFGGPTEPGVVDVFGQKLAADKATPALDNLNLKPVYLVTNPRNRPGVASGAPANWGNMSGDERGAFAQQQVAALGTLMQQLPPDQRRDLLRTFLENMGGPNGTVRVLMKAPDGTVLPAPPGDAKVIVVPQRVGGE